MQKRIFTFLFLIATVLSYSTFAEAALQFLPRYQGGYGSRTQDGGKDKICSASYQYICEGTGYAGGSGTACNDLYTSCSCSTNYKWSGGSCVLKSCSDYGYSASKDNTKSCEEKTPRSGLTCYVCTGCDSSTYKYACSGGLNAAEQDMANKCGTNYSECSCVEHASWNSTSGKCECGSDYKAGTTSCTLKTCEDYGYSATEDTTKDCTKQTPRSGLTCWNCSDCTETLYDCGSMANASGGDGTSCGGKYPKCKCKDLYTWDSGVCKLTCTRNSCSTTTYPLTAQNAANASSYEKCTPSCSDEAPRYKVSSCASGYNVNSTGSACELDAACSVTPVTIPEHAECFENNSCGICTEWGCILNMTEAWKECNGVCIPEEECCEKCTDGQVCSEYGACECLDGKKNLMPGMFYYSDGTINSCILKNKNLAGVVAYVNSDGVSGAVFASKESSASWGGDGRDVSCLTNYTTGSAAKNDMSGEMNTMCLLEDSVSHPAATYCDSYSAVSSGNGASGWYLPAAGEIVTAASNAEAIDAAMVLAGGARFKSSDYAYLTSTEKSSNAVWDVSALDGIIDVSKESWASYPVRCMLYFETGAVCTPKADDNECAGWRQYPCNDGCGGRRKCCGPYGYRYNTCTNWTAMCKASEVAEAKESCRVTWLDSCDIVGTSSPDCSEDKYYECLDTVEFDTCSEVLSDSAADFIYTAPSGCLS